MVKELQQTL